ncbi:efflux RND transporter permease subunit [Cytophaga hutchinsonii]|jgi:HAE1 family hydrophobic/amphiphilic exporter-1|uniref:Acriflavin resistance protein D n=1 Tax=Cytophaga hutchinsonii (strain ATCC 33406 / DSM 1761 / CIP 103989 / NBRC 15051 / NCIMB 9469 / D465) TaxID=269798 RepID=A0A6N4SPG1_CYTH3|nr:multidrug efflux RND transporter permease subunit [Cytophaga hutchinsonii]ABG58220.1 acriflavin resistance protein D [Cytophaga hutchinsonii ATCC 33406]SFX54783.1 hydrophobic/amphiphilic exporter-1, HAE1 family [Cytophaga hutchinsonii ATCC 33406]
MIADVFIKRPVTAIVVSVVITLVGTLTLMNLPISQYPDITPPIVQVTGNFAGADAQTVERTIATPIEAQVNGSPGMSFLQTNSTSDGTMTMNVTFDVGTNIDIATLDVQNRVSVATPQLPDDVKKTGLTVRKRNPTILMLVAMYSPNGTHDVKFMDNYTNIYIKDALLRVKGVGDIFTRADNFSMRIWMNPDKLAQYGMTANEVVAKLQQQNVQVAAGSIGSSPQTPDQAFEYSIQVNGMLEKATDFENIVVRTKPDEGSIVYLKDVARVELGKFNYSSNNFVDGKRSSYLLVYQSPGSNALETAEGVYKAMEELKKSFPNDVEYVVPFESVSVVDVSIDEVVHTLVEALLLVIVVVFLFLQSWRATLIPILAIPVSIIGTFIFFIPLGFTVNTLTLFGFVLAIGIVVDDAIVVVEATQHYIDHEKLSPKEATIKAMKDISGPVIAIALILAAVFVPVGFIPGIVGRLYQQFAITIAVSVLLSAFVALSLTPALCAMLLRPMHLDENSRGLNKFFFKFNNWFARVTASYSNGVKYCIRKAPIAIILLICIFVATFGLFKAKPTGFIPTEDEGRLIITFELPDGASTTRTLEVMKKIMAVVKENPSVNHFAALGGLNAITFSSKSNSGTLFCQLKPWAQRKDASMQVEAIIGQFQKEFAAIKEANIIVIPPPPIPGMGTASGFSFMIEQKQSNDDIKGFERVVKQFMMEANKRPEIARAFTFFTARAPGYKINVDRVKCERMGVSTGDVFSTIQTLMGSRYINDFSIYGRNFRVVTQADTTFRKDITNLDKYYVRNVSGSMIPLSSLATYEAVENAPLISHYNLFRSAEFNGTPKPGYSSGDAIKALEEVAAQVLPAGYGYEFSGLSREEIKSGSSAVYIFALSIVFVFLFLAALYESWSVPFSVMLAVPLGAFGAILTLYFLPKLSNNVYAQIGLITLIGLAAKNAILIVEFAKERVDKGMEIVAATIEAVQLRLRPILMTSLAFILGVLPLVVASGAGAVSRQTIGWTVFGGMLAATGLAIFIVPVLYVLIAKVAYRNHKPENNTTESDKPASIH